MRCPSAHSSSSGALGVVDVRLPRLAQDVTDSGRGWDSEMWEHTCCGIRVAMVMASGFPPCSSNSTSKLRSESNHSRGTWYLHKAVAKINFTQSESLGWVWNSYFLCRCNAGLGGLLIQFNSGNPCSASKRRI